MTFYVATSKADGLAQIALSYYIEVVRSSGRNHFLTTQEIPLLEELGCVKKMLPQQQITRPVLEELIQPRISLVSLPWADPFTGVIHPVHDLAELCLAKGIVLHIDVTDVLGCLDFRFEDLGCDFASFEHGVWTQRKLRSFHPGLFPMTLLERAWDQIDFMTTEVARLREEFENFFPEAEVVGRNLERVPHITAMKFPGVHPEALAFLLRRRGIEIQENGEAVSFKIRDGGMKDIVKNCVQKLQAISYAL
jgi:cysteine desulfurase